MPLRLRLKSHVGLMLKRDLRALRSHALDDLWPCLRDCPLIARDVIRNPMFWMTTTIFLRIPSHSLLLTKCNHNNMPSGLLSLSCCHHPTVKTCKSVPFVPHAFLWGSERRKKKVFLLSQFQRSVTAVNTLFKNWKMMLDVFLFIFWLTFNTTIWSIWEPKCVNLYPVNYSSAIHHWDKNSWSSTHNIPLFLLWFQPWPWDVIFSLATEQLHSPKSTSSMQSGHERPPQRPQTNILLNETPYRLSDGEFFGGHSFEALAPF